MSNLTTQAAALPQFEDRVRFNWGFHDGTSAAEYSAVHDVSAHFDSTYAEGYRRGVEAFKAAGRRPALSDAAWTDFQRSITAG